MTNPIENHLLYRELEQEIQSSPIVHAVVRLARNTGMSERDALLMMVKELAKEYDHLLDVLTSVTMYGGVIERRLNEPVPPPLEVTKAAKDYVRREVLKNRCAVTDDTANKKG